MATRPVTERGYESSAILTDLPADAGSQASPAPTVPQLHWRTIALQAAGIWLMTRIAFALVTYITVNFYTTGFEPIEMGLAGPFPPNLLLSNWQRWDTDWYLSIAVNGYEGDVSRTAFFPLFPLLIRVFTFTGGEIYRLGIAMLISNVGTLAAFIGIGLVAAQENSPSTSRSSYVPHAIGALAAYPFAFFLTAAYPDSLFLALAAFSLFFARRGSWRWAALCAFIAGLTRPTGAILILPLAWEFARQHGWLSRRWRQHISTQSVIKGVAVVGAVPLALSLYAGYLWYVFGNPVVFLQVQRHWGHQFVPLWEIPWLLVSSVLNQPLWSFTQARLLVDVVPIVVFVALTALSVRRLPMLYTLYMAGALVISLASPLVSYFDPVASVPRYLIAAFPAFLLIGRWTERYTWLHMLTMSGGFMLQGLLTGFFLMGGWIV